MKRLLLSFLVLMGASAPALAFEPVELDTARYIQPCNYWRYDSDARGYVCSSTNISFQVMEAYEVESYISDLQQQIDDLTRRLRDIERRLPSTK